MKCEECGSTLGSDARFCGTCGERVRSKLAKERACPKCGVVIQKTKSYCESCGAEVAVTPFGVPIDDVTAWRDVFREMKWCAHLASPKGNAWPLMRQHGVQPENPDEPCIISLTPPYKTAVGLKMGHSPSPGEPRGTSVTRPGQANKQAVVVVFRRSRCTLLLHERMRLNHSEYSLLEMPYSDLESYRYDNSRFEIASTSCRSP